MRPPNFWLTERRYTKDRLIRKMTRVCRLIPNFAGGSILSCQHFQENVNQEMLEKWSFGHLVICHFYF